MRLLTFFITLGVLALAATGCGSPSPDGAAKGGGESREGQKSGGKDGAGKAEGGASAKGERGAGKGEGGPKLPPRDVTLVRVQEQKLEKLISVTGTLAADEQATISTKVSGRLASLLVDLGSPVKKGQPIAELETTEYTLRVEQATSALAQARALLGLAPEGTDETVNIEETARVKDAQATLAEARVNLERIRTLTSEGLLARAELDSAQASFVRAESGLQAAREEVYNRQALARQRRSELLIARQNLADTTLRSPLDGKVERRLANVGEFLGAGSAVVAVVRMSPLRLRVDVPEREAIGVKVGQRVRVTVEGDLTAYPGKIARVSPSISQQNRLLAVEAELPNPGTLRPGSFARAELILDDGVPALMVPTSALVIFAGIEKVITVKDDQAVETPVTTGRRSGQWTEILTGLSAGDAVVAAPGNLQQGQPVKVLSTEDSIPRL